MRISVDFVTTKTPDEAFAFIAKDFFANHQKWDPDLMSNVKTSNGPIGVGTTGRAVTKFAGKQTADFEVTEFKPNKQFKFVNTSGTVNLERSYSFKPAKNGGTDINFIFDMSPKPWLMKPIFPIIEAVTRKKVHQNIKILESLFK